MSHRSLSAEHVAFAYHGASDTLIDVDIEMAPRSRVALLGANGSGKTTLLRILAGSLRPSRGTVSLDHTPIKYGRAGLRTHHQNVQLVLQNPDDQLFSADVRHDIAFGPANLGLNTDEILERVDEAMRLLSLTDLADRPTHELSYGERKRVTIAGAMAMRPCVLLLDEPTAGLDPAGVAEMFQALERLEESRTTVVLSTHDAALALDWASSVAIVEGGTVRQGDPGELLGNASLLAAARLAAPWSLELAAKLARDGFLPQSLRPRNVSEVHASIAAHALRHGGRV
ncbi:energy-coupling factor ABC transporter ATP-binding protein (plasmid) [Rhodococcus qingshengii]|uniref:energy-coupling factor ABC transporter ATP-binding protein n=1 Tax=Rhodococcus qingshengii TaxID=334542 RepID=UPI001E311B96|nr:ABC transporter ATP-binding protein [Rhodococcus qingshengii]UGQ55265.1 energy-coupling factor ABC transporter ATP-binding protein [Rhodococcus qingshengii]